MEWKSIIADVKVPETWDHVSMYAKKQ